MNARNSFLRLPVEVIHLVLELVAVSLDGSRLKSSGRSLLQSYWRTLATASSDLLPVSHTCRRLRTITLSHRTLWRTVIASTNFYHPSLMSRNEDIPLIVVIPTSHNYFKSLDHFYATKSHRFQALHLSDLGHRHYNSFRTLFSGSSMPILDRYSVDGRSGSLMKWPSDALPIPEGCANSLRVLSIKGVPLTPSCPLPNLTHLALWAVETTGLYRKLPDVLRHCPSLEALALIRIRDKDGGNFPLLSTPYIPSYDDYPDLLPRLRRVTFAVSDYLDHSSVIALEFFLALISSRKHQIAVQILPCRVEDERESGALGARLSQQITNDPSILAYHIDYSSMEYPNRILSLTLLQPNSAFHAVVLQEEGFGPEDQAIFSLWSERLFHTTGAFRAVREVWITTDSQPGHHYYHMLRRELASLAQIETLVTAYDCSGYPVLPDPTLEMCPRLGDAAAPCAWTRFRTLRLVFAYGARRADTSPPDEDFALESGAFFDEPAFPGPSPLPWPGARQQTLRFTAMLERLADDGAGAGAFAHLRAAGLVVALPPQITAHAEDLAGLRAHFADVRVERADVPRIVPELPAFCEEREMGSERQRDPFCPWAGARW
ncbi:uncharacterized protein BXZ73DRAFT_44112 [Epithele typhae]|uniref:uncharacterized protein n=1 Tax=Epithele typhae TaxID=378194 RepID=UPI0020088E85|nr:uncharacterized protein BXZ73DRAFT_44112 [Epithele typhae]KAH9938960.1 hypothetical protein BXZ73DRAFT_44112 [Epithele typhae]